MPQVVGSVTKVTKAPKQVTTPRGTYDKLMVTIQGEDGASVILAKLAKPGNDGQSLVNKKVQATYTEKELVNGDTGEPFTVRSVDSKNFILLNDDGSPAYVPGSTSQSKPSTSSSTGSKSSGYSSEGARVGMLVGTSVELATARKDTSLAGLRKAAQDLLALTTELETNALSKTTETTKTHQSSAPDLDNEESPF